MAIGTIPPWLNVTPKDFVDAASTGAALGLKRGAQADSAAADADRAALESQKIAQDSIADQARIVLAGRQLESAEKQSALESKIKEEQTQKSFLYQQQRNAMTDAYRMASLGLAKTKLEDAAKQSAMVMAQKQGFAQSVAGGMSPAEAAAKYPLAMTAGVATQIARPDAASTETVRETYPGVEPIPGRPEIKHWYGNESAIPSIEGSPARTITYKRPRSGERASPIPESLKPTATSAALKFVRDASGNLVPETK